MIISILIFIIILLLINTLITNIQLRKLITELEGGNPNELRDKVKEFKKESSIDISGDALAMQRLREAAEKAKRELDGLTTTEISLPFITADATGPKHLSIKLTKAK